MTLNFLNGGGAMGATLREDDGSSSQLGKPAAWPPLLKSMAGIVLGSPHAMLLLWGETQLVVCNDKGLDLFGDHRGAVMGQPFAKVWNEVAEALGDLLKRAFAGEPAHADNIKTVLRRNGCAAETLLSLSFVPVFGVHTEVLGVLCMCTAIPTVVGVESVVSNTSARTEVTGHAEDQLHQSQKMQALQQLAASTAHDFNNMLAGISGSVQLMQRKLKLGKFEDLDRLLERAATSVQHATAFTQTLLALAGRQPLNIERVDVAQRLVCLVAQGQLVLPPEIVVQTEISADLWHASTDAHQFDNALQSLFSNACDAMRGSGTLKISAVNLRACAVGGPCHPELLPGDYLVVSVTDNGAGMSARVLDRAFEPFFTTKGDVQGAGLGLSVVFGLMRQAGGHAALTSLEDAGTTVTLYLPRHLLVVEGIAQ